MKCERGVALLFAMSVLALATIAAAALLTTTSVWSREHALQQTHAQARALSAAGVDWARQVLREDRLAGSVDHSGEAWAQQLPAIPVPGGAVAGRIEDAQAAFNLNSLLVDGAIQPQRLAQWQRLLAILGLPAALADTLADWLDADGAARAQGAEDSYYAALPLPYFAANRALTDLGELARVRGFDAQVRARLASYVVALPVATAVNANTASAEVLAAVVDGLDLASARDFVAARTNAPLTTRAALVTRLPPSAIAAEPSVGLGSEFFFVHVRATIGDARAESEALVMRQGAAWPVVRWVRYR